MVRLRLRFRFRLRLRLRFRLRLRLRLRLRPSSSVPQHLERARPGRPDQPLHKVRAHKTSAAGDKDARAGVRGHEGDAAVTSRGLHHLRACCPPAA